MLPFPVTFFSQSYLDSTQQFDIQIAINALTNTTTLNPSVDITKAIIFPQGINSTAVTSFGHASSASLLTNSTTVTATRGLTSGTFTSDCFGMVALFNNNLIDTSLTQYGTINVSTLSATGTATISTVDLTRSIIINLGTSSNAVSNAATGNDTVLSFTNSTTVTATRGVASATILAINFVVIQFKANILKQAVQYVSVTSTDTSTTATVTITAVNTANSIRMYAGSSDLVTVTMYDSQVTMELTNSTTVTFTRTGTDVQSRTAAGFIVEFVPNIIRRIQRYLIAISTASPVDTTLSNTLYNVNKTLVYVCGTKVGVTTTPGDQLCATQLLNKTTLRTTKQILTTASTQAVEVVEFN